MIRLKQRMVAAAGHCTDLSGAGDALEVYLRANYRSVLFARHPFGFTGNPCSELRYYENGELRQTKTARSPRALSVLRDVIANLVWFTLAPKQDLFIGIDNVNAVCGIVLRAFGKTQRVAYYVIDYTPERFKNPVLNAIYHAFDRFAERYSDEVWNISQRIADVRAAHGVPPERNKVVSSGVDFGLIHSSNERRPHDLVVMAHLTEDKGVQLAIAAMRRIAPAVPDSRLLIIGNGPYEGELRRLAEAYGLGQRVVFLGAISREQLFVELPRCGIGLAPYVDRAGSITYFADPGKPKEYLACGLPVITTDVPWIAADIASVPMGLCIRYNEDELVDAALRLMRDPPFHALCAANAVGYMRAFTWDDIFDRALADGAT